MQLNLDPHLVRFLAWTFFVLSPTALGIYTLRRWRESMHPHSAPKRDVQASPPTDEEYAERLRSRYDFCTYESRFAFALGSIAATLMSNSRKTILKGPLSQHHDQMAT